MLEILSPSHVERDRVMKMGTYARHGVGEYWIVDDEARRLEIHRLDRTAKTYRLASTCSPGDTAGTPLLPALDLDVAQLFA